MQFVVSGGLGLFAFVMIASGGHVLGAIIFGPVIAAMTWGALFWRPGNIAASDVRLSQKDGAKTLSPSDIETEMSKLTPVEVGQLLARSLAQSCGSDSVSAKTKEVIESVGISIERYRHETLLLAAFAQDYTVAIALAGNHIVRDAVHEGYLGVWIAISKENEQGAELYRDFLRRCQIYANALSAAEPGEISAIGVEFGNCLSPGEAAGQLIGLPLAGGLYTIHSEATLNILRQSVLRDHVSA